jgi:Tol biopolymer transport system component
MVLFATERPGAVVLEGTVVTNGTPQGVPRTIEPDLGAFDGSRGVTQDGRLLFVKKIGGMNVFTAEIDFSTGTVIAPAQRVTNSVVPNHPWPMWSPDGRSLAFASIDRSGPSLVIRSVETGATRVIEPAVAQILFPRWTSPGFITFQGGDFRGRQGILRLDVQTGETSLITGGDGEGYRSWADATPDGRQVVFGNSRRGMFVRDLATGQERLLTATGPFTATRVSPDGRMVAYRTGNAERQSIMVVPIEGGEPRAVFTVPQPQGLGHFVDWLPDGQRVLAHTESKLVVVRLDGRVEREIDLPGDFAGPNFAVQRDGRRVAFSSATSEGYELWTLENFLPATAQ